MMNNTGRYEPNNELFKNILLAILCCVLTCQYYILRKLTAHQFEWYDQALTAGAGLLSVYFLNKLRNSI